MTTKEYFYAAYKRVCKAKGRTVDVEHAAECWRVVEMQRGDVFDEAATRLNATSEYFPTPKDWLDACKAIQGERDMAALRTRQAQYDRMTEAPRTYHCPVCLDTGFEQRHCPEPPDAEWCPICKRQKQHLYDHDYVTPCACRATNPEYQKKLDKQREAKMKRDQANERGNRAA
jgi:hypothetical protein